MLPLSAAPSPDPQLWTPRGLTLRHRIIYLLTVTPHTGHTDTRCGCPRCVRETWVLFAPSSPSETSRLCFSVCFHVASEAATDLGTSLLPQQLTETRLPGGAARFQNKCT